MTTRADDDTLVGRVVEELRRQLLRGAFPLWERLAEARLATQLGVSRTPVREALRRLEREDLVVVDDSGSYRPRAPEVAHLQDLYAVRVQLEDMSMVLATAEHRDDRRLAELVAQWREMPIPDDDSDVDYEFVFVEERFHLGLAEVGGNGALVDVLASINDRIRLARSHAFVSPGQVAATIREHRKIGRLVERREADRARERMRQHIADSAVLVEACATRALARMVKGESLLT
jgi:DNA-binding GntR family transcriptional regulator